MQKITPFLWFENNSAREVADYYLSVFKEHAEIKDISGLENTPSGEVSVIMIAIFGQEFIIMSAGPFETFNAAISFVINCESQKEIDYYWHTLCEDGKEGQCGWLTDKFGVSWQIIPKNMGTLIGKNPEKTTPTMLKMKRIIIEELIKAGEE